MSHDQWFQGGRWGFFEWSASLLLVPNQPGPTHAAYGETHNYKAKKLLIKQDRICKRPHVTYEAIGKSTSRRTIDFESTFVGNYGHGCLWICRFEMGSLHFIHHEWCSPTIWCMYLNYKQIILLLGRPMMVISVLSANDDVSWSRVIYLHHYKKRSLCSLILN